MTGHRYFIRQARDDLADHCQQIDATFIGNGAAGRKHRKFIVVDDLDAQTFGCAVEDDLIGEALQRGG